MRFDHFAPAFETVFVEGYRSPDNIEEDVVEKGLKGRDVGPGAGEEGGEGVCACYAEGEDLSVYTNVLATILPTEPEKWLLE